MPGRVQQTLVSVADVIDASRVLGMAAAVAWRPQDLLLASATDHLEASIPVWWLMTQRGLSPPQHDFAHT